MFPLRQRKVIRGAAAHVAAGLGMGVDYVAPTGTEYFAAKNGVLSIPYGPSGQGGIWLALTTGDGYKIEIAHLQKYIKSVGAVAEGELIAYTDNTGKLTTGPHAHIQIFKDGKRIDPEKYDWGNSTNINEELPMQLDPGVTLESLNEHPRKAEPSIAAGTYGLISKGFRVIVLNGPTVNSDPQYGRHDWYNIREINNPTNTGWVEAKNYKVVPGAVDDGRLQKAKDLAKNITNL